MLEKSYAFGMGKARNMMEGSDITIIGTGSMLYNCLEATKKAEKKGINAEVLNVNTLKPLDDMR